MDTPAISRRRELKLQAEERLEALLIEGLESGPATEMTDADWDEMRRRYDERHTGDLGGDPLRGSDNHPIAEQ
jgi:hypothetical protein